MTISNAFGKVGAALAPLLLVIVFTSASASASNPGEQRAGWELTERTYPTNIPPGGSGLLDIEVFNVGAAASNGTVTVTAVLPAGLEATEAGDFAKQEYPIDNTVIGHSLWSCTGASVVTCTSNIVNMPHIAGGAGNFGGQGPNFAPDVAIKVKALAGAPEHETAGATIAGGGALTSASTQSPVTISASAPPFGFTDWDVWFSNPNGTPDTQAGSHPYAATFSFDLNGIFNPNKKSNEQEYEPAGGRVRNIEVRLPAGLVGNPNVVPQCTLQQLDSGACPLAAVVGVDEGTILSGARTAWLVYNMVPPSGVAAQFAFTLNGVNVFLDSGVRSGSDYGITTNADDTPERGVTGNVLTLWGDPSDLSHDRWRSEALGGCLEENGQLVSETVPGGGEECVPSTSALKPFLTLPTACGAQTPAFSIRANTWESEAFTEPISVQLHDANGAPAGVTGCEALGFAPAITTAPETSQSDTPSGLTVEVKPPAGGLEDPEGLSTADIQNTTVTLPEGLVINPGQAKGLQLCPAGRPGPGAYGDALSTEAEQSAGEEDNEASSCPGASKVGTVAIRTPLLESASEKELQGNVYVLQSNPPELKLLVAASADGVNLKLVGDVHLDERTGRLTTTFAGTPELPFTDFKLAFSGGPQAALDTPTQCGTYTTNADFDPWSSPFVADFPTSASFTLTEGPGGGACSPSSLPFSPSLTAGATTDQAGGFTNFSLLLQRGDGQQRIEKLQFKAPAGLAGLISKVPLCTNAQAEANACPAASRIGHTVVESGPGPYPLVVPEPGQEQAPIYLTETYDGAPFGLSIVVPLHVGPFTLPTQRVRAKIEVDPRTAQITVTTDPLPQVVAGVPTDLREIDAVIDHPEFMFNPTNCSASSFSGTAWGTPPPGAGGPGAMAPISTSFGVGSCRSLEFKPKFSVSTPGRTSKADGAGLTAKLSYPSGSMGTQSNITRVKVDLPKQLPSRLTTLQKACTNEQFELNPANCPKESKIGMATVTTPVLPVPLVGPAIFVSHGGEAFPSLTMVLQGDNVTVDLVGTTNISKAGITSTTFKTVPDVPFNTFTLTLGQGKFSALAANVPAKDHYSLCGQKLAMPTEFVAQNGLKINESTPISISGCAKAKALTRSQKLTAAIKSCRKKPRSKRAGCEKTAHKRYGPVKRARRR